MCNSFTWVEFVTLVSLSSTVMVATLFRVASSISHSHVNVVQWSEVTAVHLHY